MEKTIFDGIIAGEVPADVVYRDEHVIAFRDINPQAPVHVLVVPLERMESIAEATSGKPETLGRFMQGIATVARELGLEEKGYRVVFNTGRDALQTVQYVHAHILGGRKLGWPPG
ncbi:MAG: histidine triad nucleotide-binding protein [Spirochaetaceae bacterium]|nr:MAG: histidine triad nucleotide-binding protein [Spirochaetaceae bacterium]